MDDDKKPPIAGTFAKLMSSNSPEKKTEDQEQSHTQEPQKEKPVHKQQSKPASQQEINMTSHMTSNIAILQLITSKDIEDLKEPAYMAQTYRLRKEDVEWAKDTAHALSKEFKLRKVSQTDIVRISFKLFAKLLASDKAGLKALFERIK